MIIHYYKQFFPGPKAPGSLQPRKLVQLLALRGHHVEVVTCDFNAYNEQPEPEETSILPSSGCYHVHRLPSRRGMRRSLIARLTTYTGFVIPALRCGLNLPSPDVIIASIQPLFTAVAARAVARWRNAPWLLEVRDLWPDALEAKKAISSWQARPLHMLAKHLYRKANRIVSITPGIKIELVKKGLPSAGIDVFPNGFDPELFTGEPGGRERERARLGWASQFVALFTGAHTEVTAVETIVRAAACLKHRSDIRFDLFGYGQTKPKAVALARELSLNNVHFHDPVAKTEVPGLIEASDVCLMSLFASKLEHIYFENKLMDYMGAGKAILAAMGGQQAELLLRHNAGRVVPAFDHEGLARLIAAAAEDPDATAILGRNGRQFVHQCLLLPSILEHYVHIIEAVAQRRSMEIPAWEPLTC